jgi:hypothetical protein
MAMQVRIDRLGFWNCEIDIIFSGLQNQKKPIDM